MDPVPAGYKRTEVGVIPEEWEVQVLSSLVKAGPKNGYSGRSGKDARGTATLTLGATTSGRLSLSDETVKRLEETIDSASDLFLQQGDVLVQRSNTLDLVGTTAVFDGPSDVYVYPDLMMRMRFRKEPTAHWFWRYANSVNGRRFFVAVAAGSSGTMPKISGEKLRRMQLPVPPLPEQSAIAATLSHVDALLDGLARLIAKKRDLKQAAMQQLLTGKTRLPGFAEKHSLKATVAGMIPEDWDLVKTGELASITTGARNTQDRVDDGKYPFFVRSATVERINSYSFEGEAVLTAGDGVGTGKVFHYINGKFDLHQRVYRVCDFAPGLVGYYFFLHFSSRFYDRVMSMTAKSSVDSVRMEVIAEMWVPLPTKEEQRAISLVLRDMEGEITALEARRDKTRALKRAMMQELLTGRTRLASSGGDCG